MKPVSTNLTLLALLVGISGCAFPYRDWRGDGRGDRDERGHRDRDDRHERGDRDQWRRDCWIRDGHTYCRTDG